MTEFEIALLSELRRIRMALETMVPDPEPEPEEESLSCPHPLEARIDLGTTRGSPDWQCRQCGYRTAIPGQA